MKKQITKSYLEYLGVTEVTKDGKVFTKNGELKPFLKGRNKRAANQDRLTIKLHDSGKYKSIPKEKRNSSSGNVDIRVHQVVYAWFKGEVPYGMQLHHRDGNYLNNAIDNLEALTPAEHRAKHALMREPSTKEEKCRLDIPRAWYEKKLEEFLKEGKHSAAAHTKARLRYYDSHIEEANKLNEFKRDIAELKAWKQVFKENNNKKLWHQCVTIEKMVKEKNMEAWPVVKHALEVTHKYFERG